MLARMQQRMVVAWLALLMLCLGVALGHVQAGAWTTGLAWVGLVALCCGHATVLALEFALAWQQNRRDPTPRARVPTVLRAWLREAYMAPRVFAWQQPFASQQFPDRLTAPTFQQAPDASSPARRGFVFLHGFVGNRGLWNPWLARLSARGGSFCAVNLEPLLGSVDAYVPTIDAAVRRVHAATGLAPVLVCHSMGGLAARAWLRHSQADHLVHRVVTLGTPHHGTWLSRFGQSVNGRQMRQGSRWLAQLAQDEPPERRARFICYYADCDNVVFPTSTAAWPGADNRLVPGVSHVALACEPRVMREVLALAD